ncbi:hypothetical protein [Aliiglaciecola lipolytica]|uniref:Uncharacterized protein n=1 Tax=Aliiglaciecola lipolytica E3 TaxID=1127673 RepID=K6Y5R7_9ALTE|nr:hypothetical protein [Aliiglaciecola lipolytica]GAC13582.1 hypothetical protein GLIP_0939 [Aliiglaciecola lipolytica E3]
MDAHIDALQTSFNQQDYHQVVEKYDRLLESVANDEDAIKEYDKFRALKISSLLMLKNDERVAAEIAYLNDRYQDDEMVMYYVVKLLEQLGALQQILLLKSKHRIVLATQCYVAQHLNEIGQWAKFQQLFVEQPPTTRDRLIKFRIGKGDEQVSYSFTDQVTAFNINADLPNNNMFIEFQIQAENFSAKASIPGPSNDAICETGYVEFASDLEPQSQEVNFYDVKTYPYISPFGIIVEAGEMEIIINNIQDVEPNLN